MFGCLEYDLQAHCNGVDLLGLYRKEFSVRKLIMWVRHLPGDSALASRGYAGDDRWSITDQLIAATADYIHLLDYHFLKSKGAKNMGEPKWIERPNMALRL